MLCLARGVPPPVTDTAEYRFDVFLCHASEDKKAVRAFARQLEAAGLTVWLDEEQLSPGVEPPEAIVQALEESRHVLIWVTDRWLDKSWTQWELGLFTKAKSDARKVLPVLRRAWDDARLGPYLTRAIAVPFECDADQRLWLAVCGVRGDGPGKRESWAEQGRALSRRLREPTDDEHAPPPSSVAARLHAAYERREQLVIDEHDTSEVDAEILELKREQRHGPTLHAGEFLGDGRFRLIEVIGRGGFATVWKAYDRNGRRLVAVKVLHGQFAQDVSRQERLYRGAGKMAELPHAHVVRVLVPRGQDHGFHYYVLEYLAGGDLHEAIINKTLDTNRALDVIDSVATALEVAHDRGLVHRDVKPQNILLRSDGTAALTDFDLVQAKDTTGGTRTGALGTVLFTAPEQNDDASRVDHRADIYSLGMTAVFCVHGSKLPLAAMYGRDEFLGGLSCNEAVRAVLHRAVELSREARYDSVAEFREALATVRRSEQGVGSPAESQGPKTTGRRSKGAATILAPRRGVELVRIPGGSFLMGSPDDEDGRFDHEGPQHRVELSDFHLAPTPVTNAQYGEYLRARPNLAKPKYWGHAEYNKPQQPVVGVSWEEAQAYCEWAGLVLPTEAQWEYACRAGTTTRYHSGDTEEDLARAGWYRGNSGTRLHAVGEKEANAFGLYDMHGNVWEWCADAWVNNYERAVHQPGDGLRTEPVGFAFRVLRGGYFSSSARDARSAFRYYGGPGYRDGDVGFRPAQGIHK